MLSKPFLTILYIIYTFLVPFNYFLEGVSNIEKNKVDPVLTPYCLLLPFKTIDQKPSTPKLIVREEEYYAKGSKLE